MRRVSVSVLVSAGLVVLVLAAYAPLWVNQFIDLDDGLYVWQNPHVLGGLTGPNVAWAWTTSHAGFWFPLTWMSLQLDATLSPGLRLGDQASPAAVFHGQNLFWHAATAVLLFWTLRRLTGSLWCSALVAALFAVHPLHVESVAWATERKDVLSTFFLVLTVLAYAHYAERPTAGRYFLVLASFVLGLLAKPMLVTLPFALLLLDFWPLHRWRRAPEPMTVKESERKKSGGKDTAVPPAPVFGRGSRGLLLEKVPLLAVAVAAAVVTVLAQRTTRAVRPLSDIPLSARLANAVVSYGWYLEKTFWPAGLEVFYCHPRGNWQWGPVLAAAAAVAAITAGAVAGARRWPWLAVGWLWFLGTLVPVIGLVQSGDQARADRFVYVPHVGLFVALAWAAAALADRLRVRAAVRAAAACLCLAGLATATWVQVGYWHDQETLFAHTLAVNPDNHRAHYNVANYYARRAAAEGDPGLLRLAREHYDRAIALQPDYRYYGGLGVLLVSAEQFTQAQEQLEKALALNPDAAEVWHMLGVARLRAGRPAQAEQALRRALEIDPDAADRRAELGNALWKQGRTADAEAQWQQALRANANEPEALVGMGTLLLKQGRDREAARRLAAGARSPEQLSLLGLALGRLGLWPQAVQAQQAAVAMRQKQQRLLEHPDGAELAVYEQRLEDARREAAKPPNGRPRPGS
jgi:tetratricopeptide (TPR) repeat protein